MMGERDFARLRITPAADQGRGRRRVMRTAKRPSLPVAEIESAAGQRRDRRAFQGIRIVQTRQYAGQTPGQHGLATARRPNHQQAVATCGGDFQRSSRQQLSTNFEQIGRRRHRRKILCGRATRQCFAFEMCTDSQQVRCGSCAQAENQAGHRLVAGGDNQLAVAIAGRQQRWQQTTNRADRAIERQLPIQLIVMQLAVR